ncbi:hypothetical protein [Microbacterium luticocti]|uniref:hypothetical protein n=1 Tax=Microbacterium luticocti TaxID=451764 RepID=UPI000684754A|nr:hypothetical protein [Microbacterium luticocti]
MSVVDRLGAVVQPRFAAVQRALGAPERTTGTAVAIGRVLGAAVGVCFLTGVYSHLLQHPIPGLALPVRPVGLYAWTQGVHVAVGTALIPLLLAKLWVVYPRLFDWPPVRSVTHLLERVSVAVLVATALLQVFMGTLNTFQWYPWPFSFTKTHWALAWVLAGAMLLHVGVKLPLILRRPGATGSAEDAAGAGRDGTADRTDASATGAPDDTIGRTDASGTGAPDGTAGRTDASGTGAPDGTGGRGDPT